MADNAGLATAAVTGEEALDGDLLQSFVETGSEEVLSRLINRHAPWIRSLCDRILDHHHLADDATQAVFVVLVEKASTIVRGNRLAAWLHTVARTIALRMRDAERRRKRRERDPRARPAVSSLQEEAPGGDASPIERFLPHLDQAMGRLSANLREAVVRFYLLGQSQDQIATNLGCTRGAVQRRVSRGIERLRSYLGAEGAALSPALLMILAAPGRVVGPSARIGTLTQAAVAGPDGSGPAAVAARRMIRTMLYKKMTAVATAVAVVVACTGTAVLGVAGEVAPLTIVWETTYGGPADDIARAVAADAAGNTYFIGTTDGSFAGLPHQGEEGSCNLVIGRVDAEGELGWTRQVDTSSNVGMSLAVDGAGNVYYTTLGSVGRLSADGVERWSTPIGAGPDQALLQVWDVAVAGDGSGIYVSGVANRSFGEDDAEAFLRKYDAAGTVLWTRYCGADVALPFFWGGAAVASGADGSAVLLAFEDDLDTEPSRTGMYTVHYGPGGTRNWEDRRDASRVNDVAIDEAGNVYACSSGGLVSWTAAGDERWTHGTHAYGMSSIIPASLSLGLDGSVYLTYYSGGSGQDRVVSLLRLDDDGNPVWTNRILPTATGHPLSTTPIVAPRSAIAGDGSIVTSATVTVPDRGNEFLLIKLAIAAPGERQTWLRIQPDTALAGRVICLETGAVDAYEPGTGTLFVGMEEDDDHTFELDLSSSAPASNG